jgi:phosphoglycolate phosphatase
MFIRNFILDWSGTMVDDLPPVFLTTNHVFQTCGLPALTMAEFRQTFCLPVRRFYEKRIPHVPQAELERIFLAEYQRHRDKIEPLPHTEQFLRSCVQEGMPVFVASSVDDTTYHQQMRRLGWEKFIRQPYIGIEDKTQKIHHILEENRLDPDQTMFVGDMEHDIEAGKAGGVHTCAVLSGYNHAEHLRGLHPNLVCDHLGELLLRLAKQEAACG